MELRCSTLPALPRALERNDFSNTVSTLFGLEASQGGNGRSLGVQLPAPYKTALAAEAFRIKRQRIVRNDFSSTISALFGLEAPPEKKRSYSGSLLPTRYKTALEAEAFLFKARPSRRSLHHYRRPAFRRAQALETIEVYPPWTELVAQNRTNLEQSGFAHTAEYRATFGPHGLVQRDKEQLIASRFSPRSALA